MSRKLPPFHVWFINFAGAIVPDGIANVAEANFVRRAFEGGEVPEKACAEVIEALGEKIARLRMSDSSFADRVIAELEAARRAVEDQKAAYAAKALADSSVTTAASNDATVVDDNVEQVGDAVEQTAVTVEDDLATIAEEIVNAKGGDWIDEDARESDDHTIVTAAGQTGTEDIVMASGVGIGGSPNTDHVAFPADVDGQTTDEDIDASALAATINKGLEIGTLVEA